MELESLAPVAELLQQRNYVDLSWLVADARVGYDVVSSGYGDDGYVDFANAAVYAPIRSFDMLLRLEEEERQALFTAITEYCDSRHRGSIDLIKLTFRIDLDASGFPTEPKQLTNDEIEVPNLDKLPISRQLREFVGHRLSEAQICRTNGAYLAATVLLGSALEAALLGVALKNQQEFNSSPKAPSKGKYGNPRSVRDWKLSDLIRVSQDLGLLEPDIEKPSDGLMEFRNYIHPSKGLKTEFTPNQGTADLGFRVLVEVFNDLSKVE